MKRLLRHLIHDIYPGEYPWRGLSPELEERQRQRGRDLAKIKPWESGRIGKVEDQVHSALFWADIKKTELTTGDLVREAYCNTLSHKLYGKDGPPPKVKHWMYERVRLAAAPLRIASVEAAAVAGSDGASDRIIGILASGRRPGMLLDVRKRGRGNEPLGC